MDLITLANNIYNAASNIYSGRKGFAVEGKEREGRILYETGIARAMSAFQEAQVSLDPHALILAEYTFISLEFQLCDKSDEDTINSLTRAIEEFDDAFLALQAVDESGYKTIDKAFPRKSKYRINGFPKGAYHIALVSHRTRLSNILRAPGIELIEKSLLKQRYANLFTTQNAYLEKQKLALGKEDILPRS